MKRYNDLYKQITLKYIMDIYNKQVRVNTKNKIKIYKFEEYYSANMLRVFNSIKDPNYKIQGYNIFLIKEPKYRIIMSLKLQDKIINHVFANILIKVLEPSLIDTNIATRKEKGTHYGLKNLKKYLNEMKNKPIYALKFDISKYFYTIDHHILKEKLKNKIKDEKYLKILFKIIDSTNCNVNERIDKIKNNEIIKIKASTLKTAEKNKAINEVKNMPLYEYGKGLPIGNMTSQILAIYYLNELDHFIKEKLNIKHYIRYMDDGVLLSHDKEYLKYCLKEIEKIVRKYKLRLNNKTKIINVTKEGLDFLGFRFYIINNKLILKVRNDTKKRFKRKMRTIKKGSVNKVKSFQIIQSYNGHLKWGNSYFLLKSQKEKLKDL